MDDLEARIAAKFFPKVTKEQMEARIADTSYSFPKPLGTLTICILTLDNGYFVTGESACVDPRNYDRNIGEELAYKHAFSKLWPLFGFLLAEEMYRAEKVGIPVRG